MLAELALKSTAGSDEDRIDFVMRRVLARRATDKEQDVLLAGLQRTRRQFSSRAEQAQRLISLGQSPNDQSLSPIGHAAWTSLCLAVLNLDETLTKN